MADLFPVSATSISVKKSLNARDSFKRKDKAASKLYHDNKNSANEAKEEHTKGGEFIKSFVLGGLDGIITTFAIVAAVEGGKLSRETAILMGLANLVADAMSMGFGDFLSEHAEQAFIKMEQAREEWEVENHIEGEIREMIEIYEGKGFTKEHAKEYIKILSKYPQAFVETMMVNELGLMPITDEYDEWECHKKGLITFASFICFGSIPLVSYLLLFNLSSWRFILATIATITTLFLLGMFKSKFTSQNMFTSGALMSLNGSLAASAAYGLGVLCEHLTK
eukprot:GSMAST32.ASY1.ANO1.427.1 assembled CDS